MLGSTEKKTAASKQHVWNFVFSSPQLKTSKHFYSGKKNKTGKDIFYDMVQMCFNMLIEGEQ